MAGLVRQAVAETEGGVLVFLPGEGEIRRVEALLAGLAGCEVRPLFGAMEFGAQRAALSASAIGIGGAQGGLGDLDRRDLADHSGYSGGD